MSYHPRMKRPVLADLNKEKMLNESELWSIVAPSALEPLFATYKNAISTPNQRTKYMKKLGINKVKISRNTLLEAMNRHEHNLTSVIMRLNGYKKNPIQLKQAVALMQQEKIALKHADLLPLRSAIKQAKSAMNAKINLYPASRTINFSPNKVNRLKRVKLLPNLSSSDIDNIVKAILKIPKN